MNARLLPALLLAAALGGCSDPYAATTPPAATSTPSSSTPAPTVSREDIDRQDQATDAQKRRETEAMTQRPLLDHLPLTIGDVEISIYGLAADDRHTVLQITAPDHGSGRQAYRSALVAYGDSGAAYQTRYVTP